MKQGVAGVVLAVFATASGVSVLAQKAPGAIRPEDPLIRGLVERGIERSETFRNLVGGLDKSDVVVYVRFSPCRSGAPACLMWASAGPGIRRLLVKIDPFARRGRSDKDLMALLAHELQHASEVASAPGITGVASFREWFASHSRRGSPGLETDQAVEVQRKVMAELFR